jgi:hypothetical protein
MENYIKLFKLGVLAQYSGIGAHAFYHAEVDFMYTKKTFEQALLWNCDFQKDLVFL